MSFLYDAMYLIEALPALADRLSQSDDPGLADVLLEPHLYRQREGGNSDWLFADREETAKLLFLAALREYPPLDESAGFAAVFGEACVSAAVFDRWFRLRRFMVDDELGALEARLRECPLPVVPSGRYVVVKGPHVLAARKRRPSLLKGGYHLRGLLWLAGLGRGA
jgi:hypothetical protein